MSCNIFYIICSLCTLESSDIVDVTFMTRCVAADNGLIIDVARFTLHDEASTGMFSRDVIDHYEFSFTS